MDFANSKIREAWKPTIPQYPSVSVSGNLSLSIILPIYNEGENIHVLFNELFFVLDNLNKTYEIIAINDGSSDNTDYELGKIRTVRPELKIIKFRRNFGQTAALQAGFDHASGEIIVSLDSDLQNDPNDIPAMIEMLENGYDVVSGWRRNRKDAFITRTLVSKLANWLISKITGVVLNDYGCTLKVYRTDTLRGVRLYGEMHRFIPIYASWMGGKVVEVPVNHRRRKHGKSKYGLERVFKVILDLLVVKFLDRHFVKPIYIFGGFGIISWILSGLSFCGMVFLKIFLGISMIQTPLLLLSAIAFLVGFVGILMGLLAEMILRTYFESQNRPSYFIRTII